MSWVRARRKLGGWLALFALALQLVLSFGHIHAEDFAAPKPSVLTLGAADGGPAADDDQRGAGHVDCAICAVIRLASTLLLPPPPLVALPAIETFAWFAAADRYDTPRAPRQPFQARAPPQA